VQRDARSTCRNGEPVSSNQIEAVLRRNTRAESKPQTPECFFPTGNHRKRLLLGDE
jgi:hypothetical protein